ncbi:hypothetical protein PFICI_04320 [Lecanosticta acicola]|uniref:CorA-like transporter domain-containing protein n=1 Tax=Lecanosticta acicola TaxID=111012 RepID=A0AAI8Z6E0_9PEZI|nr:hypothetical protein PFICI_04320 [Lecanosticta acicola]
MWPLPGNSNLLSSGIVADVQGAADCFEKAVQGELFYEDPEDVAIKSCTLSEDKPYEEVILQSEQDLSKHLAGTNTDSRTSRTFIVSQESSRSPLDATSSAFQALLESVNAFPAVTKIVDAFVPDFGSDYYAGRGGIHFAPAHVHRDTKVLEICALLKYVERNDRGVGVFGYSIRQMGVYFSLDVEGQRDTSILINPSIELWRRFKAHSPSGAKPWEHWTHAPLLSFTSLAAGWTAYVGELHNAVVKTMNDAAFYKPEGILKVVDTETLKSSAVFKDRLQHASHVLENNRQTLRAALDESRRRQKQLQDPAESEYETFHRGVEDTMRELQFLQNQVHLITQRLDQTATSVSLRFPVRHACFAIGLRLQFRDVATIENFNFMGRMTARSIVEAQAVRIIALITFILLPPTFTTGFLEMGFLHDISYNDGRLELKADPGLLLYLAITLPLMVVTVGGWFLWDFRTKRNLQKQREYNIV